MAIRIECLVCLKETDIPKNLNTQKYDGHITCRECGSLLQVKLVKSKVEQCKLVIEGKARLFPSRALENSKSAKKEGRYFLEEKS